MSEIFSFDPERIIRILAKYDVEYVLIGALAARFYGFPRVTADADITPSLEEKNFENLADALQELEARIFTEQVPQGLAFEFSASNLKQAPIWNLITNAGRLDIAFSPAGISGYKDLEKKAQAFKVFGVEIHTAALEDIIRSKKAADRPQDRQDIILLREILNRRKA